LNALFEKIIEWIESAWPVRFVQAWEGGIKTFCGKYTRTVGPGWYLVVPFLGNVVTMDVAEQGPDIRCGTVITKDGVELAIGAGVLYKIIDPKKGIVDALQVDKSLETVVLGTIHEYINARNAENCTDFNALKDEIVKEIRKYATERWGIKVIRVWITDSGKKYTRLVSDMGKDLCVTLVEPE